MSGRCELRCTTSLATRISRSVITTTILQRQRQRQWQRQRQHRFRGDARTDRNTKNDWSSCVHAHLFRYWASKPQYLLQILRSESPYMPIWRRRIIVLSRPIQPTIILPTILLPKYIAAITTMMMWWPTVVQSEKSMHPMRLTRMTRMMMRIIEPLVLPLSLNQYYHYQ